MKSMFNAGVLLLIAIGISNSIHAQTNGIRRTDLQRHDLSTPGQEVIQARIDLDPGITAPKHSHPGEETIYVLQGTLVYTLEGMTPVTLKAGDVLFIPAGVVHSAKNIGTGMGSELATYTVKKGKPLLIYPE